MPDPHLSPVIALQQQISALETAIAALAGQPALQAPLQVQLAEKRRQLAALAEGASVQPGSVTQYQTGGINFGVGANIGTMGDVIAGDKRVNIHGDMVQGDKIAGDHITVGDISGSSGIAIGRGAQAHVTRVAGGPIGSPTDALFQGLYRHIQALNQHEAIRTDLEGFVRTIESEIQRGHAADAGAVEGQLALIGQLSPATLQLVTATLGDPALATSPAVRAVAARMRAGGQ